jgi:hypothetical protein
VEPFGIDFDIVNFDTTPEVSGRSSALSRRTSASSARSGRNSGLASVLEDEDVLDRALATGQGITITLEPSSGVETRAQRQEAMMAAVDSLNLTQDRVPAFIHFNFN